MEQTSTPICIPSQTSFYIEIIKLSVRDATTQTNLPFSSNSPPKLPLKRPRAPTPSKLPSSRSLASKFFRNPRSRK